MSLRNTMRSLVGNRAEEDDEEAKSAALEDDKDEDQAAAAEDDEKDATAAADSDDKDEDAKDDEDEKSASASNPTKAAFALMRSPEAKGREKLATELAEDVACGRLSAKRASQLLKAAPKASRLSEVMADKDKNPGLDAAPSGNLSGSDRALVEFSQRLAKARKGSRAA